MRNLKKEVQDYLVKNLGKIVVTEDSNKNKVLRMNPKTYKKLAAVLCTWAMSHLE